MNKILQFLAILAIVSFFISCEYEFIEIATPEPPDPGDTTQPFDTIFYSTQIEPIFANSNCTGCHSSGSFLDLTTGASYNSIMGGNLAIPFDAENSKIYYYPHPQIGTHNNKYSTVDEANLIYSWIYQGCLNN
jgi:hypothetical protein